MPPIRSGITKVSRRSVEPEGSPQLSLPPCTCMTTFAGILPNIYKPYGKFSGFQNGQVPLALAPQDKDIRKSIDMSMEGSWQGVIFNRCPAESDSIAVVAKHGHWQVY